MAENDSGTSVIEFIFITSGLIIGIGIFGILLCIPNIDTLLAGKVKEIINRCMKNKNKEVV